MYFDLFYWGLTLESHGKILYFPEVAFGIALLPPLPFLSGTTGYM